MKGPKSRLRPERARIAKVAELSGDLDEMVRGSYQADAFPTRSRRVPGRVPDAFPDAFPPTETDGQVLRYETGEGYDIAKPARF